MKIEGKVAVVTGAGSGIGRATALALGRSGASVAVCDVDGEAAAAVAASLGATGSKSSVHQADVASEEQMRRLVDDVVAAHTAVDIVVNNAGIASPPTPAAELTLELVRKVVDVNFWGTVHGSLLFLPYLLDRSEASLVNVTSNASLMAYPLMAPYCASKFGARGFTEALRMEMSGSSVKVTMVCPGSTKTAIWTHSPAEEARRAAMQRSMDGSWGKSPEAVADVIVSAIRRGRPRALVGPDTRFLDGITRMLPGGHSRALAGSMRKFLQRATEG